MEGIQGITPVCGASERPVGKERGQYCLKGSRSTTANEQRGQQGFAENCGMVGRRSRKSAASGSIVRQSANSNYSAATARQRARAPHVETLSSTVPKSNLLNINLHMPFRKLLGKKIPNLKLHHVLANASVPPNASSRSKGYECQCHNCQ